MNRSIALFIALAVLVAHSFALAGDGAGGLAPPHDFAYATLRLARNIVYDGTLAWGRGIDGLDAVPSLAWTLIAYVGEQLYLPINTFVQAVGTLAAIGALVVSSRFHSDRTASLITPLLLAISGGFAAAATSGTHAALAALLLIGSFLAFERGRPVAFATTASLLVMAVPEGAAAVLTLALLRALPARGGSPEDPALPRALPRVRPAAFLAPALVLAGLTAWRLAVHGTSLAPNLALVVRPDAERAARGLAALVSFARVSASPLLLVYALWYLLRRRLSGTGRRALVVSLVWGLCLVLEGGGTRPFYEDWVPLLPLLLITAQEGMITALNSWRAWVRGLAWSTFLGAVVLSALASRTPADLGPLPLSRWQSAWAGPPVRPAPFGYEAAPGRAGLEEELEKTAFLRAIGLYLRDQADATHEVGTFWPGAIGYLSRLAVFDLAGRATPPAPGLPQRAWTFPARFDLLAALATRPDYLVPWNEPAPVDTTAAGLATALSREVDEVPFDDERLRALTLLLDEYELVTVPITLDRTTTGREQRATAALLRRRELALHPRLELVREGERVAVRMRHGGPLQVADLAVTVSREDGGELYLAPDGTLREERVLARVDVLVHPTGDRAVDLTSIPLADGGPPPRRISAQLLTPGVRSRREFTAVSPEAVLELR